MTKPVYKYSPMNYPQRRMSERKLHSEWIRCISYVVRLPPSGVGCRTVKHTRYLVKLVSLRIHKPGQVRTQWITLRKRKLHDLARRLARKWKLGLNFAHRAEKSQAVPLIFFVLLFVKRIGRLMVRELAQKNMNLITRFSVPVSLKNSVEISVTRQLYFSPISRVLIPPRVCLF